MRDDDHQVHSPVLENLEPRLLLSGGMVGGSSEATDALGGLGYGVQAIDRIGGAPTSAPYPPPAGSIYVDDYLWIEDNADYDWWFGCAPTAAGMLTAYWDYILRMSDPEADVFPGESTDWVYTDIAPPPGIDWVFDDPTNTYTDIDRRNLIESELFSVPKYANGVVSGWNHIYEADWDCHIEYDSASDTVDTIPEFALDTWWGHAPDSISDFLATETVLEFAFDGSPDDPSTVFGMTDPFGVDHGLRNFLAWDDPRTEENESWSVQTSFTYYDPDSAFPYSPGYVESITAGQPMLLFLEAKDDNPNAPGTWLTSATHTVLGVGYEPPEDGASGAMWVYTGWGTGLERWDYPSIYDIDLNPVWRGEGQSGYGFNIVGSVGMGRPTRSSDLTGYFAIAHEEVADLEVYIGLGDPGSSDWISGDLAAGHSGVNLVLTDIDLSDAISALESLHDDGRAEQWFLKVVDSTMAPRVHVSEIMDFQIRYDGQTWYTGEMGAPIALGEGRSVYVTTDLMGSISGRWYQDDNANGRDDGEPAAIGQTVHMFKDIDDDGHFSAGEQQYSTVTDVNGEYTFDDLMPGTYVVYQEIVPDRVPTAPGKMGVHVVPLTGQDRTDVDLGSYVPGSISGLLWHDVDGSGTTNLGDAPMPGYEVWVDFDLDGLFDAPQTQTFDSLGTPTVLPDLTTTTSEIVISGLGGAVLDVDVELTLTHDYLSDLEVSLISPSGRTVVLLSHTGGLVTDQTIVFDDESSPPFQPLALLDGEDPNGIWTLVLADTSTPNAGTLEDWSLMIRAGEPSDTTVGQGNYTISGLAPGEHIVVPGIGPTWEYTTPLPGPVTVASGSNVTGVDFGVRVADLPDLRATGPADSSYSPAIVLPGDSWQGDWRIENVGTATAGQFDVAFYASLDADITEDDYYLGTVTLTSLDNTPGSNAADISLVLASFPSVPVGNYYVGVVIDPADDILESDESNNTSADDAYPLAVPGIGGRLWAEQSGNEQWDAGEPALSGWTVFLDGTGNGLVDGRLTGTEIFTTTDADGIYSFPGLTTDTYHVNVVLPSGWQLAFNIGGALVTIGDLTQVHCDTDFGLLSPVDLYDTGPATSFFTPSTVGVGQTWSLWWDISNSGSEAATTGQLDFYAFLDGQDIAEGYLLGSADIANNPIPGGGSQTFQLPLAAFPQIPAGTYRVGVVIDSDNENIELDELNNTGIDDQFLVVRSTLDLASVGGQWVGPAPSIVHAGDRLEIAWTIANEGSASSGGFFVDLYVSADTVVTSADVRIASTWVTNLAAGQQADVQLLVHSLPQLPVGQYYVGVIIDKADIVSESNESNNTGIETSSTILVPGIAGSIFDDPDGDGHWTGGSDPTLAGRVVFIDSNQNGSLDRDELYVRTDGEGRFWFAGLASGDYYIAQLRNPASGKLAAWRNWEQTSAGPNVDGSYTVPYAEDELVTDGLYFGNALVSKISGTVWHDMNGNDIQEGGVNTPEFRREYSLTRWEVDVFRDEDGDLEWDPGEWREIALTETGCTEAYQLSGLLPGIYVIQPALHVYTQGIMGYPVYTSPLTPRVVDITGGTMIGHRDFGIANAVTISGTIWEDMNADGARDTNDEGVGGWAVYLDTGQVAYTNENGDYSFTGLAPGDYTVTAEQRTDWVLTYPAGGQWDVTVESRRDGVTPSPAANFGNYQYGQITGVVWHDYDADGYMAGEETGRMSGWTVFADVNSNGTLDAGEPTDLTDPEGVYVLGGMMPGTYEFRVLLQGNWQQSYPGQGLNWVHSAFIFSGRVYGTDPAEDSDFGVYLPGTITGRKWEDLNGDGFYDPTTELGLAGWSIFLDQDQDGVLNWTDADGDNLWDNGEGEQFAVTTTDGSYSLPGLIPATTYHVAEQLEPGWKQSYPGGGYDVAIIPGQVVTGVNFGNYMPGTISGMKWNDLNGDGVFDAGEPGLPDWVIFLDENNNHLRDWADADGDGAWDVGEGERWVLTDTEGNYLFDDLSPGLYQVNEEMQPGWSTTYPFQQTTVWWAVSIVSGTNAVDLDFGNTQVGRITGAKWQDMDGDGIRDGEDDGVAGWVIYLDTNRNDVLNWVDLNFDGSWDPGEGEQWVLTDVDGNYEFTNLSPATYYVSEVPRQGWTQTYPDAGRYEIDIASGTLATDVDFGNSLNGTISGFKWNDLDADGLWDANEQGIAGWDITIFMDRNGNTTLDPAELDTFRTVATDLDGSYLFYDLEPGDYIVAESAQADWIQTWPVAPEYHQVTMTSSGFASDLNFGNARVLANPMTVVTGEDQQVFEQVTGLDPEGGFLTFLVVDEPAHGTLVLDPTGTFQYVPEADWHGTDSFTFRATSVTGNDSDPDTVTVVVNPINDKPTATRVAALCNENSSVAIPLSGTDLETDPADLTFAIITQPSHGTVNIIGSTAYYTPTAEYVGPDSFGFVAIDTGDPAGVGTSPATQSDEATVSITVMPVNGAPTANSQVVNVPYDYMGKPIEITLTGVDVETPAGDLVYQIAGQPAHGTVSLVANIATYTPFAWWTGGTDSFTFTVTDNGNPAGSGIDALISTPATVTVALPDYEIFWQGNNANHDYADQRVVCQLRGPGQGVAYYSQTDPLLIERIILTGTTGASILTVNVQAPVFYKIGEIEVRGSVKAINAPGLNLVGDVWVQGWTGAINLRGTFPGSGPHTISIGAFGNPVNLTFGQVADLSVDSAAPIGNVKVMSWHNTDGVPDVINSPSVKSIRSMGSRQLLDPGHFQAGLDVGMVGTAKIAGNLEEMLWEIANDMRTLTVAGSIINGQLLLGGNARNISAAQWDGGMLQANTVGSLTTKGNRRIPAVTGDLTLDVLLTGMDNRGVSLGRLSVYGTARDASVRTLGSMSKLQMGATDGSDFLAGIDNGVARYADSQNDFINPLASIGSVKVKGLRIPRGLPVPRFVADSNFSAATIGTVGLLNIDYDNDSDPFGIFALNQPAGNEVRSVKATDTVTGERWSWPDPSQVFARPDMVIQII